MAVRLLWQTSPATALVLGLLAVAGALLPNAVRVFLGASVGEVPAAARAGLDSAPGHRLAILFVAGAVSYTALLVLEPVRDACRASLRVRLTHAMQQRLMSAVNGPTGIAHLEDRAVLDKLAMAQGSLLSFFPADAPTTLSQVIGLRLGGVVACAVVASFRWWLGLGLLVFWLVLRQPMRRSIIAQVASTSGEADVMRRAHYFRHLATKPQAAKETRVFGLGDWVLDQFRSHWLAGMDQSWRILNRLNLTVVKFSGAVLAAYGTGAAVLAYAAIHHEVGLTTVAVVLPSLLGSAQVGSTSWPDVGLEWMVASLPHLEELEAQLASRTAALPGADAAAGLPTRAIRFEGVRFRYPGGAADVFEDLDLTLRAGQATAIVGANGAGKTTLIKLVARLHDPIGGRITVDDDDLASIRAEDWQRRVAVVFQDFNRYPLSAAENVGLGAPEASDDEAGLVWAAERAGAAPVVGRLARGWDTRLSPQYEGGVDLSGGEWQRIALARALFAVRHGATVLVLDEPTAWLDVRGEAEFFARFLEITEGITTVIVSHRFSTVRLADHICVLDGGRVAEEGTHESLVAQGGTYAGMFELQAAAFVPGDDTAVEAETTAG